MQIKALRNAVHKDMSDLAGMAQQQATRAADAEKRLVRSVGCGVQILQRRERAKLLQSLLFAWRCAAFHLDCLARVLMVPELCITTFKPSQKV